MKPFDYSITRNRKTYKALIPLAKIVSRCLYKINYVGLENIPRGKGFILASNHITAFDPVHLGAAVAPSALHFMGKEELFKKPLSKWFLTHMNGFPVKRGANDKQSIEYAIKLLENGDCLGIFPEGKRSPDYTPQQAKAGVALIAKATHADILPASLYSCDKMKKHTRLTIRFGQPITYEELGISDEEHSTRELREASKLVMERITELWNKGHEE